jgi:rRNA-processing protein FCF1
MPPRKRKSLIQVKLRIPEDLKRQLDREAQKRDDLSLSAEIADRLRKSFETEEEARRAALAILEVLEEHGLDLEKLAKQRMHDDWQADRDPEHD